ncbi:autophagy protein Apg17-domain-containing protein [Coprinopsis sp. MPI-PUGE-AT-0042]|nr:autophagy protein Apg17-domain-containing protein [Coprinopsis sp. MPI-PUGE-AT-0042]
MSNPKSPAPEHPHLVSLVLESEKALQQGQQVCARAQERYNASAQEAVDVLALDAKVRWMSDAILEQLKLAAGVARCIEEKRVAVARRVKEWDTERAKSTDALEAILDSLGHQVVPPDFHETSAASSIFGSQHSDDEGDVELSAGPKSPLANGRKPAINGVPPSPVSPAATIRRNSNNAKASADVAEQASQPDRSRWKTLRDFVDDRAIEDILETIENDRNHLEDIINQTDDYPSSLRRTVGSLREIHDSIASQETFIASMAEKLDSLLLHFDQMAEALKDCEAGVLFGEDDLGAMDRDTEELPVIMTELGEAEKHVADAHEGLVGKRKMSRESLDHLTRVLNDLDELGDIMGEMLNMQDSVEVECEESLTAMSIQLETLDHLHQRYVLYQTAFNKLLLEIARRRHYKTSVEQFVKTMQDQLRSMVEEENEVRKHFNAEYGAHLPEDICLCIANEPTRYDVLPWPGELPEVLPAIGMDLLSEARARVEPSEKILVGPESL